MKEEMKKQTVTFPGEELDERERVWYFGDYAAGVCLSLVEGFMQHAQIPEKLKPVYGKAIYALRYILRNDNEYPDADTYVEVLMGLHCLAECLPALNAEYITVDSHDEIYAQANRLIARRILPALRNFAVCTQFPPNYFCRIYMDIRDQCLHWDAALKEMIFAFEYLENPARYHNEQSIKRMQTGLHLFAEYLQEMYNV